MIKNLADAKEAIRKEIRTRETHPVVITREITDKAYEWGLMYGIAQIEQAETEILRKIDALPVNSYGLVWETKDSIRKIFTGETIFQDKVPIGADPE